MQLKKKFERNAAVATCQFLHVSYLIKTFFCFVLKLEIRLPSPPTFLFLGFLQLKYAIGVLFPQKLFLFLKQPSLLAHILRFNGGSRQLLCSC